MSQAEVAPSSKLPLEEGEGERLRSKARQCDDAWRANIGRLADSQGNEVFKYLLLLTCVECHSYVTETQIQAVRSFRASIRAAGAGFCLVVASILAMLVLPMVVKDFKVEIATISVLSGVMTTFISTIFFKIYRESQNRMERFHNDLREAQRIACGLFLNGLAGEVDRSDGDRTEILRFLMNFEDGKLGGPPRQHNGSTGAAT